MEESKTRLYRSKSASEVDLSVVVTVSVFPWLVTQSLLLLTFLSDHLNVSGIHLYSWVERGVVKVKCLVQEHNTVTLARA